MLNVSYTRVVHLEIFGSFLNLFFDWVVLNYWSLMMGVFGVKRLMAGGEGFVTLV